MIAWGMFVSGIHLLIPGPCWKNPHEDALVTIVFRDLSCVC